MKAVDGLADVDLTSELAFHRAKSTCTAHGRFPDAVADRT